jgi:hypothetical protein
VTAVRLGGLLILNPITITLFLYNVIKANNLKGVVLYRKLNITHSRVPIIESEGVLIENNNIIRIYQIHFLLYGNMIDKKKIKFEKNIIKLKSQQHADDLLASVRTNTQSDK